MEVARPEFRLLRTQAAFEAGAAPPDIQTAQEAIRWAEHLVIVYPLWLGTMPALLKGFLEQAFRPGFAFDIRPQGLWDKRLKGRSARIVVTMGMPALVYRWYFGAHILKSLERNILGFCGIRPIRESLFGMVEAAGDATRRQWLERMRDHGRGARCALVTRAEPRFVNPAAAPRAMLAPPPCRADVVPPEQRSSKTSWLQRLLAFDRRRRRAFWITLASIYLLAVFGPWVAIFIPFIGGPLFLAGLMIWFVPGVLFG